MNEQILFEVKIRLATELEELASSFLMEQGVAGIVFDDGSRPLGVAAPAGSEIIFYQASLTEVDRLYSRLREYIKEISELVSDTILPPPQLSLKEIDPAWQENWKQFFKPKPVGQHFIIAPPWEEVVATEGRIVLIINPGLAFGTGQHPTTMMCLEGLEVCLPALALKKKNRIDLLDVGTGSGILAIAAAKLARPIHCTGIDIDKNALISARENMSANQVEDFVLISEENLLELEEDYDIVVANIQSDVLCHLAPELVKRTRIGGYLILSGIIEEHLDQVMRGFSPYNLDLHSIKKMAPWQAIIFARMRS
jgi:ribosomal protein L11 methyltransferase